MASKLMAMLAERRGPAADDHVDVGRMHRDRHARLQAEMERQGVDLAVLLHGGNVAYATGVPTGAIDVTHATFERPVAVVVAGDERPYLLADGGGDALLAEAHPGVWPELEEGAALLARALAEISGSETGLAGRRVAVDVQTGAMLRAGVLDRAELVDAAHLVGPAKLVKTDDELACIAEAQQRSEVAMVAAQQACVPGATRSDVAGAFLAALRDVGVEANMIDPIFQPMARSVADGPRTTTGDVAFPTGVGNPVFAGGDLIWVDAGVDHLGYASDFGRTWIVGREPDAAERRLFDRWCDVMTAVLEVLGPGVTSGDLCRAAIAADHGDGDGDGDRPWLPHFYLAHGVGVESAEMPLVGTDLGPDFDDGFVLAPGMVLVFEPVAWEDGAGGYRAEEIVAVTLDGWRHLGGGHAYEPFTEPFTEPVAP